MKINTCATLVRTSWNHWLYQRDVCWCCNSTLDFIIIKVSRHEIVVIYKQLSVCTYEPDPSCADTQAKDLKSSLKPNPDFRKTSNFDPANMAKKWRVMSPISSPSCWIQLCSSMFRASQRTTTCVCLRFHRHVVATDGLTMTSS